MRVFPFIPRVFFSLFPYLAILSPRTRNETSPGRQTSFEIHDIKSRKVFLNEINTGLLEFDLEVLFALLIRAFWTENERRAKRGKRGRGRGKGREGMCV